MSLGLWEFFWPGPQGNSLATELPPRGPPRHPAYTQSVNRVPEPETVVTRPPVITKREERRLSDYGWVQPAFAAQATPVVQMPFNQFDWPVPRGPAPVPQDFHASFPLPLQEVIQPNQYDWPVPKGPEPLNRGWIKYILPWAQAPPINQVDWPVPPGPRRNPQDWSDSFKLPLQQTLPLNQYDWPNPPLAARRNPQDWTYFILPNRQPTGNPFFQTDWPNPRGAPPIPRDWQDWFKLPLQQTLPPRQLDWPNPGLGPQRASILWTYADSFKLPLQQNQPLNQHDWPNPVLRIVQRPDWILPQPYTLNVQLQTNPAYSEWGVPWGPQRPVTDWILPQPYVLNTVVANPFFQTDWPLPRGPLRGTTDWKDSFKLPLQQSLPPGSQRLELPVLAKRNPQDWAGSFPLPLQQNLPKNQYNWPNPPLAARRNPQDWLQTVPLALSSSVPPPIAQYDWPVPKGPAPRQAWTDSFKLPLQQNLPKNRSDWPNPVLARKPVVADWILSVPSTLTFVQPPLNQRDWPNPSLRKGRLLPTWTDSFKLPLQQTLPPRQLDWPVPKGRRHPGEAVNYTLLTPPAPPIPPVYDPDLTLKNERIRLRFLENQNAQSGRVRFLKNEVRR